MPNRASSDPTTTPPTDRPDRLAGAALPTMSGPAQPPEVDDATIVDDAAALRRGGLDELARATPFNRNKPAEYGRENTLQPPEGVHEEPADEGVSASTSTEAIDSDKLGDGSPMLGANANDGVLDRVRTDATGRAITTNQGVPVADNQNSLKAGLRGPTLLEDFILREKITHFDHERIPERVVHARGSAAHGTFECYEDLSELTKADLFSAPGKRTPVFVRFSTVAGERGSADTVRDTRGFAVKFYTRQGNWDLVGNNMPVFFIQDAMKFPDLVHAVKPEPHHGMPQASSAHDTFWDFMSLMPESLHHTMWAMSDRGIPRSYRTMQGFGVHTFRLIDAQGNARFVKFHWLPVAGTHSLVWDEAVKINGADPDFHRRDLWESIEAGHGPEYELALQVFTEEDAERFTFDVLDATKLIPEELVPLRVVGKMTLDRNPDNFFAETEQVAFCTAHVVPGIDFSNDPLLQGRNHSYLDTQLSRLGGPNFHEIPVNSPLAPVHNNQRDAPHRQAIHRGAVSYEPNSLGGGCPHQAGMRGFVAFPEPVKEDKLRGKPEKFADHYSQPRLFWRSQTPIERKHIADAFRFELSRVTVPAVRERVVSMLVNVDQGLADEVAHGLGLATPPAQPMAREPGVDIEASKALSMFARPGDGSIEGRRVALLAAHGVDAAALEDVQYALLDEGAVAVIVGPKLAAVRTSAGDHLQPGASVEAVPSVLWDAVVLPAGDEAAKALANDAKVRDFVRDAYMHCKPILCLGDLSVLEAAGIRDAAPDEDDGLVCDSGGDADADGERVDRFIAALARHRHFEREAIIERAAAAVHAGSSQPEPAL